MRRTEQLKIKLHKIEESIRKVVGNIDPDDIYLNNMSKYNLERIEKLLYKRCIILNKLFQEMDEEIEHFIKLNNHLLHLRNELYRRSILMKSSIHVDIDFDDDYEIEGSLRFCYNSEESILQLSNDDFYGTDFKYMISVLSAFYHCTGNENIGFEIGPNDTNILDDGKSWVFPVFLSDKFKNIIVGYASYYLCFHKHYSIPDFIRLNDFNAEVKLVAQSMTNQNGERYNESDIIKDITTKNKNYENNRHR